MTRDRIGDQMEEIVLLFELIIDDIKTSVNSFEAIFHVDRQGFKSVGERFKGYFTHTLRV